MLLIAEKGTRGGICLAIRRYDKANNNYMKKYDKKNYIIMPHVFRCKQFVWVSNVSKTSCKWFGTGRRSISV